MSFPHVLDPVATWATANQPVVVGIGVALAVLLGFLIQHRRRTDPPAKPAPASAAVAEKAASWAPPEQSYADRRGAVRRDGPPIRVLLTSATFRNGAHDGYVLDRSTSGLRLASPAALPPGSTIQVRATNAPDTVGFVTVIVRSCRKTGEFFEVGCEFEQTPPWNVLLLFG